MKSILALIPAGWMAFHWIRYPYDMWDIIMLQKWSCEPYGHIFTIFTVVMSVIMVVSLPLIIWETWREK